MTRIIKLTEQQLLELDDVGFDYFNLDGDGNTSDVKPYNQSEISADGPIFDDYVDNGKTTKSKMNTKPTGDRVSHSVTPQSLFHNRKQSAYGAVPSLITCSKSLFEDFANESTLVNGEIPVGIESKLSALANSMSTLQPKKQFEILSRFIDMVNLSGLGFSYKKELINKINYK